MTDQDSISAAVHHAGQRLVSNAESPYLATALNQALSQWVCWPFRVGADSQAHNLSGKPVDGTTDIPTADYRCIQLTLNFPIGCGVRTNVRALHGRNRS
jgi:hypothetical protein